MTKKLKEQEGPIIMELIAPRTYKLDPIEAKVYSMVEHGKIEKYKAADRNTILTRLRRNGLIENVGSRGRPEWKISDNWKTQPYSYLTKIILPDGETNDDPILLNFDKNIEEIEEVLSNLKARRDEYVAAMNKKTQALRTNQSWRKFQ